MADLRKSLSDALFADPAQHAYAILDGAQNLNLLLDLDRMGVRAECLLIGHCEPEEKVTAAHLAPLKPEGAFFDWIVGECLGLNRCVFATAQAEVLHVAAHLQMLSMAFLPDGRIARFRYHDPRILRVFLPTCDETQRGQMFGAVISRFVTENAPGAEPSLLTFDA